MKPKHIIVWWPVLVALSLIALVGANTTSAAGPDAASYELLPTGTAGPHLFAEGVISTPNDEAGGVFSPDGRDFYFAMFNATTTFPRIGLMCVSHWQNGKWTAPEVLPFSGKSLDFPPRLSPDGQTMYFSSSRVPPGMKAHVLRIWKVKKTKEGWGVPEPLPAPINAPEDHWNWGASVTKDGTLYFTSDREQAGRPKIYRSRLVNGAYQDPEKVADPINSKYSDYDPFISADETVLFFVSAGDDAAERHHRDGTLFTGGYPYARGDIYISRNVGGKWSAAQHVERGVNTVADEDYPALTPDGKQLVFSSERSPFTVPVAHKLTMDELEKNLHGTLNGHGNIYTIPVEALDFKKER
jgi:Tol biopolymer transport system component